MPKYDRQLIIMFHCGNSDDVKVVKDGAHLLNKKGQQHEANSQKSQLITAPVSVDSDWYRRQVLKNELHKLTANSRLYIYGHCDWAVQKVGTYTGIEMADLLNYCGLPKVKLISIVACKAARDYDDNNLNCFASHLLKRLAYHNCQTEVFARCDTTGMWPKKDDPDMLGRKWTRPDWTVKGEAPLSIIVNDETDLRNQEPKTKWKFTYENTQIKKEVVRYKREDDD
jgi:hypothetical protein